MNLKYTLIILLNLLLATEARRNRHPIFPRPHHHHHHQNNNNNNNQNQVHYSTMLVTSTRLASRVVVVTATLVRDAPTGRYVRNGACYCML